MRSILFILALACTSLSFSQELEFNAGKNIGIDPIYGLKKPNSAIKSTSIDSTFIFASDTLSIPVFDDFSTNKFQVFQGVFNAPGNTQQTYYRLLNPSTNLPLANGVTYTNQATFRRTFDVATETSTDVVFPALNVIENNLTTYPPVGTPLSLYPPYYIYDTVGVPDQSDTIWISNPAYFQDSATVFFQTIEDSTKIWIDRMAYHNMRYGLNPRSLGVATFDGLDEDGYPYQFGSTVTNYGDRLTSKCINLSNYNAGDSLYVSFLYQPEGLGDVPEAGDSLILEFYATDLDQWKHIWSVSGSSVHPFKAVHIPVLDDEFFRNGFKMRFKNYGALSGSLDHFHIDYVHLRALSDYTDTLFKDFALCYPLNTLLQEYTSVPWDHYKNTSAGIMTNGLEVKVYNGSNSAENYQNGQIDVKYNSTQVGNFSLPGFLLAEGNINYNPNSLFTSYHDLSAGYEFDRTLPGNQQVFTVNASVSAQFPNLISNDTCQFLQGFYNYYSYDDGSAEAAFGPTGAQSMLAVHFNAYESDSLLGVYLHFVPSVTDVSNKLFYLTVWDDVNGQPGNILFEDDAFSPRQPTYANGLNNFNAYYFPNGQKVPVGSSFFVGWRQVDAVRYNLGLDRNIDHSQEIFYSVDFGATWENPPFPGSAMLRPIVSTALDGELGMEQLEHLEYAVYPNPTQSVIHIISPYSDEKGFELYDIQGRFIGVHHDNMMDLSVLQSGYYFIRSIQHPGQVIKILRSE
ncbi:MAG: T9SS type A sorting domain-containing protein [Flavobacteriales bacterium]